jgi:hypothetical protein
MWQRDDVNFLFSLRKTTLSLTSLVYLKTYTGCTANSREFLTGGETHKFCTKLSPQTLLLLILLPTQFPCFLSICLFIEVFINLKTLRMLLSETEGELPNPLRGFRTSSGR